MPSPTLQALLSSRLLVLLAAVVFGAVCTHWGLQLRGAPATVAAPAGTLPVDPPAVADPASLHLFGVTGAATAPVAEPPPNMRLIGMIAAVQGQAAVAILMVDGRAVPARIGELLAPGITLQEIRRDRVVLDLNGQRSDVMLGTAGGASAAVGAGLPGGVPGMTPAGPVAGNPGAAVAVPPFKLEVQSLGPNHLGISKGELNRALQDPRLAASMGRATANPATGLTLEDVPAGSLSDRLGLKPGDVLRSANGQALTALGDLPRLYQAFGTSTVVRLDIVRGGQPATLQYTVRP